MLNDPFIWRSFSVRSHSLCWRWRIIYTHTTSSRWTSCWTGITVMTSSTYVCTIISHSADWSCDVFDVVIRDAAAVTSWITDQLKALCVSMTTTADEQQMQHQILSGKKFPPLRRTSLLHICLFSVLYYAPFSMLHHILHWNSQSIAYKYINKLYQFKIVQSNIEKKKENKIQYTC